MQPHWGRAARLRGSALHKKIGAIHAGMDEAKLPQSVCEISSLGYRAALSRLGTCKRGTSLERARRAKSEKSPLRVARAWPPVCELFLQRDIAPWNGHMTPAD